MWHQLLEALSAVLFAIALIALKKLLPFDETYNILVAGVVGVAGFTALFFLYWQLRQSRWIRKATDDLYSFEGDWLETWSDENKPRYSIATIRFDDKTKQYMLAGNAYDKNGKWLARWNSCHVFYDRQTGRLVHVWDGRRNSNFTFGATLFQFDSQKERAGTGFFIDDRPDEVKRFDLSFERLVSPTDARPWKTNPKAWIKLHHTRKRRGG